MDYEKKYKNALEWARQVMNGETGFIRKEVEEMFPELKESEDERIRKALVELVHDTTGDSLWIDYNVHKEDAIAWFEKQGKKPQGKTALEAIKEERVDNQNCVKLADKVESKFHEWDWVVYKNDICQIVKREEGFNKLVTIFGEKKFVNERNLSTARLWTIQEARPGDVLIDGTTIFMFKDLLSDGSVMSYCDYDANSEESDAFCPLSMNFICVKITPATKEQRDILFQKMHEAGYMWDSESKQLLSLKAEVVDEQKPAKWSEEDETKIKSIIALLKSPALCTMDGNKGIIDENIKYLKSLKDRYTWKPSDEQIEALLKLEEMHVLEHEKNQENAHLYMIIKSIREQLLKLREE